MLFLTDKFDILAFELFKLLMFAVVPDIVLILAIELLRIELFMIDTLSGLVTSPVFVIVVRPEMLVES